MPLSEEFSTPDIRIVHVKQGDSVSFVHNIQGGGRILAPSNSSVVPVGRLEFRFQKRLVRFVESVANGSSVERESGRHSIDCCERLPIDPGLVVPLTDILGIDFLVPSGTEPISASHIATPCGWCHSIDHRGEPDQISNRDRIKCGMKGWEC